MNKTRVIVEFDDSTPEEAIDYVLGALWSYD